MYDQEFLSLKTSCHKSPMDPEISTFAFVWKFYICWYNLNLAPCLIPSTEPSYWSEGLLITLKKIPLKGSDQM